MRLVTIAVVLLPLAVTAVEAQNRYTEWAISSGTDNDSMVAGTINQSGQILGQGCWFSNRTCYWMIVLDISCTKGIKGDVMVSADTGPQTLEVSCLEGTPTVGNTRYRYAFTNFEAIDRIVRTNTVVGFASALRSGEFQVVRFNLNGAPAVVDAMLAAAEKRAGEIPWGRGTRDKRP
jgi:hypothetical protein